MNRVALVEDYQRMSALLVKALLNAGIETDTFEKMESAALTASAHGYAVLVIDRGLTGMGLIL
jgi:two-component system response regulator QseB